MTGPGQRTIASKDYSLICATMPSLFLAIPQTMSQTCLINNAA
jgi:hypothetical protein